MRAKEIPWIPVDLTLHVPFVTTAVCPCRLSMSSGLLPEPGIEGERTGCQHNWVILYFARSQDLLSKMEELLTIPPTEIWYFAGLCAHCISSWRNIWIHVFFCPQPEVILITSNFTACIQNVLLFLPRCAFSLNVPFSCLAQWMLLDNWKVVCFRA